MLLIVINAPLLSIRIFIKDVLSVRSLLNSNGINKTYALKISGSSRRPRGGSVTVFQKLERDVSAKCEANGR